MSKPSWWPAKRHQDSETASAFERACSAVEDESFDAMAHALIARIESETRSIVYLELAEQLKRECGLE